MTVRTADGPPVTLARIDLYPVKSWDGVAVGSADLLANGAPRWDRRWAVVEAAGRHAGRFVDGKREPRVHGLAASYTLDDEPTVTLSERGRADAAETFRLAAGDAGLGRFLSGYFGRPVAVRDDPAGGFPDDTAAPGPTVVSTATLRAVGEWFGLDLADVRRRFRTNLELDAPAPFWEDRLFAGPGGVVPFTVGDAGLAGVNPCARCVVPSRDPDTGAVFPGFAKRLADRRRASLPPWAEPARFDHHYRLAVNTRGGPGRVRVGDAVRVGGRCGGRGPA